MRIIHGSKIVRIIFLSAHERRDLEPVLDFKVVIVLSPRAR